MSYSSSWRSPSNIALIKYWGKYGLQLPRNPSLSFTLSACHTDMNIQVELNTSSPPVVYYQGKPRPAFSEKITSFFAKLNSFFPWLTTASVTIDSVNTFPHGAGIASSASAMSALALCLQGVDDQITGIQRPESEWWMRVSEISRLGSGSACRSVFPGAAVWGKSDLINNSNDHYAIPWLDHLADGFKTFEDTILIVSDAEKKVSSTAGHQLMEDHPYATARYTTAHQNMHQLVHALQEGDYTSFITVVESEALQLHAMMMSGTNPFILMEPNTISILKAVWQFRSETLIPVCFTLDAGPNVHLLYPAQYKTEIGSWITSDLLPFCANGQYLADRVGAGPEKLS